jgi:hypothetical protein
MNAFDSFDVIGRSARLLDTDANPRRTTGGHVSTLQELPHYLLLDPSDHAALVLHREDDDIAVRERMPAMAAAVAPRAAGEPAADVLNSQETTRAWSPPPTTVPVLA